MEDILKIRNILDNILCHLRNDFDYKSYLNLLSTLNLQKEYGMRELCLVKSVVKSEKFFYWMKKSKMNHLWKTSLVI